MKTSTFLKHFLHHVKKEVVHANSYGRSVYLCNELIRSYNFRPARTCLADFEAAKLKIKFKIELNLKEFHTFGVMLFPNDNEEINHIKVNAFRVYLLERLIAEYKLLGD